MADRLWPGRRLGDRDPDRDPASGLLERARPLLRRARESTAEATGRAAIALGAAGRAGRRGGAKAWSATSDAAGSAGDWLRATGGAGAAKARRATATARERLATRRAAKDTTPGEDTGPIGTVTAASGPPTLEILPLGVIPRIAARGMRPDPSPIAGVPTGGELAPPSPLALRLRRITLRVLYVTGLGVARLLGIVSLVVLLAVMAGSLVVPAVLPGAKLVKGTTDRFGNFPPLAENLGKPALRTTILAADNSQLTWLYDENRKIVRLKDVPMLVRQAVLAIEDSRFYEHKGVDLKGIARAARVNFSSRTTSQGGSTLTQQFIKLVTDEKDTTLDRKVQEAKNALELEKRLSKDQILENYLNLVYFGDRSYGIATAAEHFFSKPLDKLTLAEAASLAGTIADPNDYHPGKPKQNVRRRNLVLDRMRQLGWASAEEVEKAKKSKLKIKVAKRPDRFGAYHTYVTHLLRTDPRFNKALGKPGSEEREWAVTSGGLRVKTTLITRHQRAAQRALTEQLDTALDQPGNRLEGAMVSIDPNTGAVMTMVGGRKFDADRQDGTSAINYAVDGSGSTGYSPGSAFKAFFMVAALEQGFSPLTTYSAPSTITITRRECPAADPWTVGNAEGGASGPINLATATANSVNTYYAQLADAIGPSAGVEMARRLGISTIPAKDSEAYNQWNVCSAVLGPRNVTVHDMASAYGVLANDGVRCEPYAITSIRGPDNKLLYEHKPNCKRVLSQKVARTAVNLLEGGPAHGTGTRAQIGRPLAGKTGTAQDYTSSFFSGFTPQIATAVWVGHPKPIRRDGSPNSMLREFQNGRVYGGTFAALIFHDYMLPAHSRLPVQGFPNAPAVRGFPVPDVRGASVDEAVGQLRAVGLTGIAEPRGTPGDATVTATVPAAGSPTGRGSVVQLLTGPQEGEDQDGDGDGGDNDGPGNGPGNGRGGGGNDD